MKIGMTGSKHFTGKQKIKDLIWLLKQKTDEPIEIISLGEEYGADKFVKKYALRLEMDYKEFLPYHKRWNLYCHEPAYLFSKQYSARYFFICFNNFVKYCDKIVFFKSNEDKKDHPIIQIAKKNNKELIEMI